ncbi:MAG: glycosyltransferase family 1 protein [Lachnospiraceae bacterium]|jgi:hypothetical protein|nr:glycosyltransferase family 1 protein [Lachnospiraceae bacterium]
MKKIIMFKGDIETQGYFSEQMAKCFRKMGHEVLVYDLERPWEYTGKLLRFVQRNHTVVISFNFHGMCGEAQFMDEEGNWFWDAFRIPCYNIVVDHPMFYYNLLSLRPKDYHQISIDREHQRFMNRFFPEVDADLFLPLAGTPLKEDGSYKRWQERRFDVVMTGNYGAPERFDKFINRNGEEYAAFYRGMIEELLASPDKCVTQVCMEHIRRQIPQVTEAELKETMPNITFIDLYVRHARRRDVVRTLVDAGIRVHVFGGRWDEMECDHPENLINEGARDSQGCLEAISDAKISLNVMPWFKEGAHDRIYNSMLNGAVSLTDSNGYLDSILLDGLNCRIYQGTRLEKLPQIVRELLNDPGKSQQIADAGFCMAASGHRWADRCQVLHDLIESAGCG